jgi:uncharacterized membrane protein YeaQ/YmgE (transglycosylase-associated protein family)
MFHILWTLIIGAIVGYLAELLMPGGQHLPLWKVILLGIGGSYVGGLIGRLFSKPKDGALLHPAGLVMSIVGALVLLYAYIHFVH